MGKRLPNLALSNFRPIINLGNKRAKKDEEVENRVKTRPKWGKNRVENGNL